MVFQAMHPSRSGHGAVALSNRPRHMHKRSGKQRPSRLLPSCFVRGAPSISPLRAPCQGHLPYHPLRNVMQLRSPQKPTACALPLLLPLCQEPLSGRGRHEAKLCAHKWFFNVQCFWDRCKYTYIYMHMYTCTSAHTYTQCACMHICMHACVRPPSHTGVLDHMSTRTSTEHQPYCTTTCLDICNHHKTLPSCNDHLESESLD